MDKAVTECIVIVPWVLGSRDRERIVNQIDSLSVQGFKGLLKKTSTTEKE